MLNVVVGGIRCFGKAAQAALPSLHAEVVDGDSFRRALARPSQVSLAWFAARLVAVSVRGLGVAKLCAADRAALRNLSHRRVWPAAHAARSAIQARRLQHAR